MSIRVRDIDAYRSILLLSFQDQGGIPVPLSEVFVTQNSVELSFIYFLERPCSEAEIEAIHDADQELVACLEPDLLPLYTSRKVLAGTGWSPNGWTAIRLRSGAPPDERYRIPDFVE